MKQLLIGVALACAAFFSPGAAAQNTVAITVTESPVTVTASEQGYFGVLYENSATPSAAFVVTPAAADASSRRQLPYLWARHLYFRAQSDNRLKLGRF